VDAGFNLFEDSAKPNQRNMTYALLVKRISQLAVQNTLPTPGKPRSTSLLRRQGFLAQCRLINFILDLCNTICLRNSLPTWALARCRRCCSAHLEQSVTPGRQFLQCLSF
jgi:hypothetical protein